MEVNKSFFLKVSLDILSAELMSLTTGFTLGTNTRYTGCGMMAVILRSYFRGIKTAIMGGTNI